MSEIPGTLRGWRDGPHIRFEFSYPAGRFNYAFSIERLVIVVGPDGVAREEWEHIHVATDKHTRGVVDVEHGEPVYDESDPFGLYSAPIGHRPRPGPRRYRALAHRRVYGYDGPWGKGEPHRIAPHSPSTLLETGGAHAYCEVL